MPLPSFKICQRDQFTASEKKVVSGDEHFERSQVSIFAARLLSPSLRLAATKPDAAHFTTLVTAVEK